jgi:hypothetical protein
MIDFRDKAKRAGLTLLGTVVAIGAAWIGVGHWLAGRAQRELDAQTVNLFEAFGRYKQHVGEYPKGANHEIVGALSGHNSKKVIILAIKPEHLNAKGEVIDPWGTPLRLYFSDQEVLVRSAGPNRMFEDSAKRSSDDCFRSH